MADLPNDGLDLSAVPLFPLPNVVLFPRAVLPLHIFEERYKAMTAHALEGNRLVALALLKSGWEKNYYARPAIESVVCVGRILTYEQISNGEYNFLLQGCLRARVVAEGPAAPFRRARLEPLNETHVLDLDLEDERRRLCEVFEHSWLTNTGIGRQFRTLLSGPISTAAIADLVAFNFVEDFALKQSLLADPDVRHRVARLVESFEASCSAASPAYEMAHDSSLN